MKQRMFLAAAFIALVAAIPAAPFHIATFAVGKPASGIVTNGKPVVVVAFASWCVACLKEMPEVIGDYERLKDRVTFIGLDYMDSPAAAQRTIAQYKIPFDVVMDKPDAHAPPPANPNEKIGVGHLSMQGVTPKLLAKMTNGIKNLPPALNANVKSAAKYCASHDDAACIAYAKSKGIEIGGAAETTPTTAKATTGAPTSRVTASFSLPRSFVIDAKGIVRAVLEGYSPQRDYIKASLAQLGYK